MVTVVSIRSQVSPPTSRPRQAGLISFCYSYSSCLSHSNFCGVGSSTSAPLNLSILVSIKLTDIRQKQATIVQKAGLKTLSICCLKTPLPAYRTTKASQINLCLLRINFCETSQNKAQLQINGLITNGTANDLKVYPNFAITSKTSRLNSPKITLLQPALVKHNRPRTGVGLFRAIMYKSGMASLPTC